MPAVFWPGKDLMIRACTALGYRLALLASLCAGPAAEMRAEVPSPVLHTVFPAGGQAGTSVTLSVAGSALDGLRDLHTAIPRFVAKKVDASRFALTIPAGTPPGLYDLRAVGTYGMSSPRAFFVSNRTEQLETEPNDLAETAQSVPLDSVVNGRIEKSGDVDFYRFNAKAGQRVVLECWAERIDSQFRAVLELYDTHGKRLAVNRGHTGLDPLVDFFVPADGTYLVKLFDLSFLGGAAYFYRLDIDTKPRVEFAVPCVVTRGQATRVRLFGRNLVPPGSSSGRPVDAKPALDCVEVDVTPPRQDRHPWPPAALRPAQIGVDYFPVHYPGGHAPVLLSVTDVPVLPAGKDFHDPDHAEDIAVPCEVSGALSGREEQHWYAVRARRGEVFWLEAFGERIGSPVDLDVTVLDSSGRRELTRLADHLENLGGYRFPTAHVDPVGRWVAPADGRYLLLVRNLVGGQSFDPRRLYRLSVRREEPDFRLAVVSRRSDQPAGLNVCRGGREWADVLVFRRRGLDSPIRVSAESLPPGIHCPDIWIGPGQDCAPLVVMADRDAGPFAGALHLCGRADSGGTVIVRPVRGGTMVWPRQPLPSGRLTQEVPLATGPEAGVRLTAPPADAVVYQDSVLDVAVDIERHIGSPGAAVSLSGAGLPRAVPNALASIPAGKNKGWISFFFPASLPPGPYTIAVQGETQAGSPSAKDTVTVVSNPIVVHVRPARINLELDPRTPRKIARGKIIQLRFTAERKHGFLGKVHTILTAPDGLVGLRARGVTLVGQTDAGVLQVIATEDAPLGRQPFLRLDAVGTVEDQPLYRASRFVELEITE